MCNWSFFIDRKPNKKQYLTEKPDIKLTLDYLHFNFSNMKTLIKLTTFFSVFIMVHSNFTYAQSRVAMSVSKSSIQKTYIISKKSVLTLDGKTNVNSFTCGCNEEFQRQALMVTPATDGSLSLNFHAATLKLGIKSLDCGNKLMNKDLQKALHADEHPYITIELKKVEQDRCNRLTELKDWVRLKALAKITLNGYSKEYWLNISAKKYDANRFQFIGSKTLNMTDFCVIPPVAMMGMIKVQDAITINLDLEVTVE